MAETTPLKHDDELLSSSNCSVDAAVDRCPFSADGARSSCVTSGPAKLFDKSSPIKINWALTYSSDEESSPRPARARELRRSQSDPALCEESIIPPQSSFQQGPRQRSRSSCSHSDEELALTIQNTLGDVDLEEEKHKSALPKQHQHGCSSKLKSVVFCTPVRWLSVLFVATCYTTFWLPYPKVRPPPALQHVVPAAPVPTPTVRKENKAVSGPGMYHARASPEVELTFRPGLERYYAQEGFSDHAWTKYANISALGAVLIWAAWEKSRRGESSFGQG